MDFKSLNLKNLIKKVKGFVKPLREAEIIEVEN
jgi:hypothetical protein